MLWTSPGSSCATRRLSTLLGPTAWRSIEGRFNQGIDDPTRTLDVQSWGALFLLDDPSNETRVERAASALAFANATFLTSQVSALEPHLEARGYAPYDPPLVVWSEGSYGVALAYSRLGDADAAATVDADLAPLVRPDGAVLYAANTSIASPWYVPISSFAPLVIPPRPAVASRRGRHPPSADPRVWSQGRCLLRICFGDMHCMARARSCGKGGAVLELERECCARQCIRTATTFATAASTAGAAATATAADIAVAGSAAIYAAGAPSSTDLAGATLAAPVNAASLNDAASPTHSTSSSSLAACTTSCRTTDGRCCDLRWLVSGLRASSLWRPRVCQGSPAPSIRPCMAADGVDTESRETGAYRCAIDFEANLR